MPTVQYRTTTIEVDAERAAFLAKTTGRLDELWAMRLGQQLFADIRRRVIIVPTPPGGSNMCTSGGDARFFRLRAALYEAEGISVQAELGYALMGAAAAGWTLQKIGHTLAGGMSAVTSRTAGNVKQTDTMTPAGRDRVAAQIAQTIEDVADGVRRPTELTNRMPDGHTLGDHLLRLLKPWLRPGAGSASRINYDPDQELSCAGDRMQRRPPTIGLAHELCHAWRNAVGERLFDDAQSIGVFDDEVMTTGFPPYQYEKYSENLFRAQWTGRKIPLRVNYR